MSDVVVERLPADEAFDLVAHETRFRTLEVLADAAEPVAFSVLRERVSVDDPGQFNYHLRKLDGRFVTKQEGDGDAADGYELTAAGRRVFGAVLSGGYTKAYDADPVPLDDDCVDCGGAVELRFHESKLSVTCRECGIDFMSMDVPPGVLEGRSREDAPGVVDRWLKRTNVALDHRLCYNCDGGIDRGVVVPGVDAPEWLADDDRDAVVVSDCGGCGSTWQQSVPNAVATRPAIVGFLHGHGVDARATPLWSQRWLASATTTVVSEDPVRVEVTVEAGDEVLVATFDRDLELVAERRE